MSTKKSIRQAQQVNREIEKAIAAFSQHLMSDSKWVRLIEQLVAHLEMVKIEFKQVHRDQERTLYLYDDMELGFDFWPTGFEIRPYKEIEYLVFPRWIDDPKEEQDLARIEQLILQVGQFDLETTDRGLKLFCYKD